MKENNLKFQALSRMCLNNWHYIDRKVLSFNKEINFFTGHSGSGKSTIIDAMQIVLYANTDGRGFFNKAASDDSDRSLIEYLRGMVNIGENNEFSYLRNKNFSSTIVLELTRADNNEKQCVGVVFDVDTATNEIGRLFFWHEGALWDNSYRSVTRCMSTEEVRAYLQKHYTKDAFYCGSHNERFRTQLYDNYLGGLDKEKFPLLFKRAIPFRMNGKLEDFVREYICMEQDIHIEDMQESVMQYGRMRRKIEDTQKEIEELKKIQNAFEKVEAKRGEAEHYAYFAQKFDIMGSRDKKQELETRGKNEQEELEKQELNLQTVLKEEEALKERRDTLLKQIAETGVDGLKKQLRDTNELLEAKRKSKGKWDTAAHNLKAWENQDSTTNAVLRSIDKFEEYRAEQSDIVYLQKSLLDMREEVEGEKKEVDDALSDIRKKLKQIQDELGQLNAGQKAYPKELRDARELIASGLARKTGQPVRVEILADLLDLKDETWRDAVEGYMGNNKLSIIVEPEFVKDAMEIYQSMDKGKYYGAAVLDTEKVMKSRNEELPGALSEEVNAKEPYVKAYISYLLGHVIKCDDIDELREHSIGITADCMLYHGFKLQHINPNNYTKYAYIGKDSIRRRIKNLQKQRTVLEEKRQPLLEESESYQKLLDMEYLANDSSEYMEWLSDIQAISEKEAEKEKLIERIRTMEEQDLKALNEEFAAVEQLQSQKREAGDALKLLMGNRKEIMFGIQKELKDLELELAEKEAGFKQNLELEAAFSTYKEETDTKAGTNWRRRDRCQNLADGAEEDEQVEFEHLMTARFAYLRLYPNRRFSAEDRSNQEYDKLLSELACDGLESYREKAKEQARVAVRHFKDDFQLKIRSAIIDAQARKEDLNRIISHLDFGKDKYQFSFTKNKGVDGKYYDMFMDESLEVDPSLLTYSMGDQIDMFSTMHEETYGELINELISIFIPPENATEEELEEAKKNMVKYADYRTYLSFDMVQTIHTEDGESMKLQLSKMIKKNSGGEGQNPRYVALLASFAQAYRIGMSPKLQRHPTIRLVVLDEAFSKMDGEKVASCIRLIRDLGFQVIISATNDKIQNYLENVDKTFVFANPSKKNISIQEFEKTEFGELEEESSGDLR